MTSLFCCSRSATICVSPSSARAAPLCGVGVDVLQPLLHLGRFVAQGGLGRGLVDVPAGLQRLSRLLLLGHEGHLEHGLDHGADLGDEGVALAVGLVDEFGLRRGGGLLVVGEQLLHLRLGVGEIGLQLLRRGVVGVELLVVASHPAGGVAHVDFVGPCLCVDARH